ncbi:hypothetical protein BDP27DRAFT_1337141 [Rhodocollybia butyracea]|uniref:Uncharacterized protein n=1 Tax=Rhodocollybia butyracea TaxID=206335 RepID=A0A9P5PAM6_9AGAR|nr:hypothetical protein BDP27DRAFT_1337141 [Rhodocollybia butyracea]
MPVGEDHVMCGETWSSLTVRLATENELGEKLPYNTTKPCSTMSSSGVLQCPLCLRFSSVKKFGRCIGAPTAEFPLLETQGGMNTRKRKRTESRAAHEVALAPCHDCLDNLGEDEGATWGRCDNADCWSRRGESSSKSGWASLDDARNIDRDGDYSDKHSCFDSILGMPTSKNPISLHPRNLHLDSVNGVDSLGLGLVCPKCTPEGGLGCSHKWICDICAFWDKHPLVWECPGCLNDYCDECEDAYLGDSVELERCVECGRRDLCGACRRGTSNSNSPVDYHSCSPPFELKTPTRRQLTWRCRLCSLPVCKGCVPSANSIHECRNCNSQLCRGCRSVLACQSCGEDMCQLCLGESLVMLCRKCEDVC